MTSGSQRSWELQNLLGRLLSEANACAVFLVDKAGEAIASVGAVEVLGSEDLKALTEFDWAQDAFIEHSFREGDRHNYQLTRIHGEVTLVVVFDERSSLGLVRLTTKKVLPLLVEVLFPSGKSGPSSGGGPGGGRSGGGGSGDEARAWVGERRDRRLN